VFGKATDGLDVVDDIATTQTAAGDRPVEDVVIETIEIAES
jgi:cyclophilin family peptidyl-prolyl cis-trans isomerase